MLTVVGLLTLLLVLAGALTFRAGWKNEHPGMPWPARAWLSFGGAMLVAIGIAVGSWGISLVGLAAWLLARLLPSGEA